MGETILQMKMEQRFHKIAHIGPRSGDVQFFAVEQKITSKFDPVVTVDGAKSFEKYVCVNEMNSTMKPRIMEVSNNRIGITTEATERIQPRVS